MAPISSIHPDTGTRSFSDWDLSVGVESAYSRYATSPTAANPPASWSHACASPATCAYP